MAMVTDESTLSGLPNELHMKIITFLHYHSILHLRLVCRHFRELIKASDLPVHCEAERSLLFAEEGNKRDELGVSFCTTQARLRTCHCAGHYPKCDFLIRDNGPLPCYTCLRWLDSTSFIHDMSRSLRALGQVCCRDRVCIPCGIRTGRHRGGSRVGENVVCIECSALFECGARVQRQATLCYDCRPDSWEEHVAIWHRLCNTRRAKKYLEGMRKGKEYRDQKGARLRRERGIPSVEVETGPPPDPSRAIDALLAYNGGFIDVTNFPGLHYEPWKPRSQVAHHRWVEHRRLLGHRIKRLARSLVDFFRNLW